jgi:hypothetical protein
VARRRIRRESSVCAVTTYARRCVLVHQRAHQTGSSRLPPLGSVLRKSRAEGTEDDDSRRGAWTRPYRYCLFGWILAVAEPAVAWVFFSARQTEDALTPRSRASALMLRLRVDPDVAVAATANSSAGPSTAGGRPRPAASCMMPSTPPSRNRRIQRRTVGAETPSRAAIALTESPSAAIRTMALRRARRCGVEGARDARASRVCCSRVRTIVATRRRDGAGPRAGPGRVPVAALEYR